MKRKPQTAVVAQALRKDNSHLAARLHGDPHVCQGVARAKDGTPNDFVAQIVFCNHRGQSSVDMVVRIKLEETHNVLVFFLVLLETSLREAWPQKMHAHVCSQRVVRFEDKDGIAPIAEVVEGTSERFGAATGRGLAKNGLNYPPLVPFWGKEDHTPSCPVVPFFLFFGKGSL